MQKWEYLIIVVWYDKVSRVKEVNDKLLPEKERPEFYSYLQELGSQGWELVSIETVRYAFKRLIE